MDGEQYIDAKDIEQYKLPWESNVEWNLRRKFIYNHRNKFSESRLICLSQVFANVEFLGCSYPAKVMEEIDNLSEGLVEEYRQRKQEEQRIMFVKAEEEKQKKKRVSNPAQSWNVAENNQKEKINKDEAVGSCRYKGFVRATSPDPNTANTLPLITKPLNNITFTKPSLNQDTSIAPSTYLDTSRSSNGLSFGPSTTTSNSQISSVASSNLSAKAQQFKNTSPGMMGKSSSLPLFQNKTTNSSYPGFKNNVGINSKNVGINSKPSATLFEAQLIKFGFLLKKRQNFEPNVLQLMDICANKCQLKLSWEMNEHLESPKARSPLFTCKLMCNHAQISYAKGMNKKNARINAYNVAFDKLTKPFIKIVKSATGRDELVSSEIPITDTFAKNVITSRERNMRLQRASSVAASFQPEVKQKKTINDFVIVERLGQDWSNSVSILQESADFCKIEIKYEYDVVKVDGRLLERSYLFIEGELAAEGIDITKLKAKHNAADAALKRLKELRPTVRIKKDDINAPKISRSEVIGETNKIEEHIPDDNIGNKMLRKMGWAGGGVGKAGNEGIQEPVKAVNTYGREGLGLGAEHTVTKQFLTVIDGVVKTFAHSNDDEMRFSPEFSKEERAAIHRIADRYHLRNVSRGKGANRYLVLSRKLNPQQLINHLQQNGGITNRFELVGPQKTIF